MVRIVIIKLTMNICINCGLEAVEQHHVVPLSLGGNDIPSNLVWLCSSCHGKIHQWNSIRGTPQWKELQRIGIEKAKKEGRMGRPSIKVSDNFAAVVAEWKEGKITAVEAMKRTGLSKATFYRKIKNI